MPRKKKPGGKYRGEVYRGEIVRLGDDGEAHIDLTELTPYDLNRHIQTLHADLARHQLDLANLEIAEARARLMTQHESLLIEKYIREIAALDRNTPGGLKSVEPGPNDVPELVYEAWRQYVQMQRGGGSRF